jgi:hypothetical protein
MNPEEVSETPHHLPAGDIHSAVIKLQCGL